MFGLSRREDLKNHVTAGKYKSRYPYNPVANFTTKLILTTPASLRRVYHINFHGGALHRIKLLSFIQWRSSRILFYAVHSTSNGRKHTSILVSFNGLLFLKRDIANYTSIA